MKCYILGIIFTLLLVEVCRGYKECNGSSFDFWNLQVDGITTLNFRISNGNLGCDSVSFSIITDTTIVDCKAENKEFVNPPDVKNHKNINLLPKDCGLVQPQKRIIGGEPASLYEFPWAVLLAYEINGKIRYNCVGTVINKRYILTSAVCGSHKDLKTVRLGEYKIDSDKDCETTTTGQEICAPPVQDISVETSIVHPDRNSPYKNDIALLRLSSDITFNDAVSPVCLPLAQAAISNPLTVVGWGKTENESTSNVLLKAKIPYVNQKSCQDTYKNLSSPILIENEICAGEAGKDTCRGDSGGPLLSLNNIDNDVKYVQIGITSFGPSQCGVYPAVYTNVALYIDWILDNLN